MCSSSFDCVMGHAEAEQLCRHVAQPRLRRRRRHAATTSIPLASAITSERCSSRDGSDNGATCEIANRKHAAIAHADSSVRNRRAHDGVARATSASGR